MSAMQRYPHHVPFKRTSDWWDSGGTWYQISTWNNANCTHCWEYVNEKFMFKTAQEKAWFILRWL